MDFNDLQALMSTPLGRVVENINQVFWVCSADLSQTLYVSPAYERIWGRSTASLYEHPESFTDPIHPDDKERVLAAVSKLLEKQEMDEEYRIIRSDKSIRWIHDRAFPLFDDTGNVSLLAGIAEDITERKEAEIVLAQNEEKFQQFAKHAEIVFWVCEPDVSKFHYISPGYEKIWGRKCAEIYENPRSFPESVHPDDLERVVAAAVGENACNMDEEYRIIRPDGTQRWIRDRTFPIYDVQGNLFRMGGTASDITSRKQAEEETLKALQRERELSEAKSQFIATTSHEIRTPLTEIQSSLDMLQHYNDRLTEDRKAAHFQKIETAVQNIKQIVQDVLLLSEDEADTLQFQPTNVNAVDLCQEAIASVTAGTDNQNRIEFTTNIETNTQMQLLDANLVNHILTNLLRNALKYSPQDTNVKFDLNLSPTLIAFSIQDRGIGISKEDLPNIFNSFHRASNVGTLRGMGLGLAIVKQCVDLHKGKIAVNSAVGEGTTFTITLPLA